MVPLMAQGKENGIGLHVACVGTHWVDSGNSVGAWHCRMDSDSVAVVAVAVVEVSVLVGLQIGSAQVSGMR